MMCPDSLPVIRRIRTRKEDLDIEVRYDFSQYGSFMNLFRIPGTTSSAGPVLRPLLAVLVVADHTLHFGEYSPPNVSGCDQTVKSISDRVCAVPLWMAPGSQADPVQNA
jgi:hypothetical protein